MILPTEDPLGKIEFGGDSEEMNGIQSQRRAMRDLRAAMTWSPTTGDADEIPAGENPQGEKKGKPKWKGKGVSRLVSNNLLDPNRHVSNYSQSVPFNYCSKHVFHTSMYHTENSLPSHVDRFYNLDPRCGSVLGQAVSRACIACRGTP